MEQKSKISTEAGSVPQAEINRLVDAIAPLNNLFRERGRSGVQTVDVLKSMWVVGELLTEFLRRHNMRPHPLYWRIYGRSDGLKNSYLTRDFLSYCLRIHKYFTTKQEIESQFPTVSSYGVFREAFPLLENNRHRLPASERAALIALMNSPGDVIQLRKRIKVLKFERIGKRNDRKGRLHELREVVTRLVDFDNDVRARVSIAAAPASAEKLREFADFVAALTQENLYVPSVGDAWPETGIELWDSVGADLKKLFDGSIELRNRLRRLFPPRKASGLSDNLAKLVELSKG